MTIRTTKAADLDALLALFAEARSTIAALGIDQWQNGYPSREVIEADMQSGTSYAVLDENGTLCATFVLVLHEPTYDRIEGGAWLTGDGLHSYVAMHRVAVSVARRGQGIPDEIVAFASAYAARLGRPSLRIDTHEGNRPMRRMLEKRGFLPCGTIYLESGEARVGYEKRLSSSRAAARSTT